MNTLLKSLGSVVAGAVAGLVVLACSAQAAAPYHTGTLLSGVTISNATVTVNSPATEVMAKDGMILWSSIKGANAGTSNVVFTLQTSLDASNWQDVAVTLAANGTNTVITRTALAATNFTNVRFFRLQKYSTTQTNNLTLDLKYGYWSYWGDN